jgi:hypothetical protein
MGEIHLVRVAHLLVSAVYTIDQTDWLFPVGILNQSHKTTPSTLSPGCHAGCFCPVPRNRPASLPLPSRRPARPCGSPYPHAVSLPGVRPLSPAGHQATNQRPFIDPRRERAARRITSKLRFQVLSRFGGQRPAAHTRPPVTHACHTSSLLQDVRQAPQRNSRCSCSPSSTSTAPPTIP